MRKTLTAALLAASLLSLAACQKQPEAGAATPSAAAAGDGIDGTWKADLATVQIDAKPDQLLLKGGQYSCPTCTPPLTLAADGGYHAVTGRPYSDAIMVKVDDDHTVTIGSKKGGKDMGSDRISVSADGKTLTDEFTDKSAPDKTVTGSYTETRVADAPAGAHAISGSWKMDKYNNVSDEGLTETFKVDNNILHMTSPVGQSFDAKLDGTDAPIVGDVGKTMVSAKKTGDNAYQVTAKRDGKVLNVRTYTIDGDTLHIVSENKRDGSTLKYDAKRS
jgi:hypothetical protein